MRRWMTRCHPATGVPSASGTVIPGASAECAFAVIRLQSGLLPRRRIRWDAYFLARSGRLKTVGALLGLLALPMSTAQSKTDLNIGWLAYSNGMITQTLSVWNNARLPIKSVQIDCRFFSDEDQFHQIAAGSVQIDNIQPSAAGHGTLSSASRAPAKG